MVHGAIVASVVVMSVGTTIFLVDRYLRARQDSGEEPITVLAREVREHAERTRRLVKQDWERVRRAWERGRGGEGEGGGEGGDGGWEEREMKERDTRDTETTEGELGPFGKAICVNDTSKEGLRRRGRGEDARHAEVDPIITFDMDSPRRYVFDGPQNSAISTTGLLFDFSGDQSAHSAQTRIDTPSPPLSASSSTLHSSESRRSSFSRMDAGHADQSVRASPHRRQHEVDPFLAAERASTVAFDGILSFPSSEAGTEAGTDRAADTGLELFSPPSQGYTSSSASYVGAGSDRGWDGLDGEEGSDGGGVAVDLSPHADVDGEGFSEPELLPDNLSGNCNAYDAYDPFSDETAFVSEEEHLRQEGSAISGDMFEEDVNDNESWAKLSDVGSGYGSAFGSGSMEGSGVDSEGEGASEAGRWAKI